MRHVRLISGIVLFVFVVTHLANHMLGLVSLEVLERGREVFLAFWRNPAVSALLTVSFLVHLVLAPWALYERRRLRMSVGEAFQLALGFSVPFLLLGHILGTRMAHSLAGTDDSYTWVLLLHWKYDQSYLIIQPLGLLAAWVHGCIGLHFWLRLKPYYGRIVMPLFGAAVLVPVLSLLGYAQAGREVLELAESRVWLRETWAEIGPPDNATAARINLMVSVGQYAILALFGAALAGRYVRSWMERWKGFIHVTYPGGAVIASVPGRSILDISRAHGIPHASVCGGRGRCSTCRVRVVKGLDCIDAAAPQELRVLQRIGNPINVRLACQTRPQGDVEVVPLLPPTATARDGFPRPAHLQGEEREVAVLFADLRSFTQFAETKLPYDVVFVLNRYFANMGHAVEKSGGHLDKFIGDGVMALFGLETDPATAARQSLAAAREMARSLADLNRALADDLDEPLRIGIGIHLGHAIVGEMGYGSAVSVTAVGDTVNTASRLEALTKEFGAQLVVSTDLVKRAGTDLSGFPTHTVPIRGRRETLEVSVIVDAAALKPAAAALEAYSAATGSFSWRTSSNTWWKTSGD